MTIAELSPSEKAELLKQLAAEQKSEKERKEKEIATYKDLQDKAVSAAIPGLVKFSESQKSLVETIFADFGALVALKKDLYTTKETQDSHTFTSRDGMGSITIGYNAIIGFDGTEAAGVQMVKEYISNMSADDDKRKTLGDLLNTFMKTDKNGNLNPTRIAELVNKKAEVNDPLFTNGVDTIVNAQFKTRTSTYVRGWQRIVEEGKPDVKISFSITA